MVEVRNAGRAGMSDEMVKFLIDGAFPAGSVQAMQIKRDDLEEMLKNIKPMS